MKYRLKYLNKLNFRQLINFTLLTVSSSVIYRNQAMTGNLTGSGCGNGPLGISAFLHSIGNNCLIFLGR